MVSFANPVRGTIHQLGWARPAGNIDFQVTRPFGDMSFPALGPHNGIDLGNGRSGDPVLAAGPGKVVYAAADPVSGGAKIVIVDHGNGYRTWYAHLGTFNVGVGQTVVAGQQVGTHDTTGWATAAHLHFQVDHLVSGARVNVDPWPLLAQNQAVPQYAVISLAGVVIRSKPTWPDPTSVYRTTNATYLVGMRFSFGGFVNGQLYRYGTNGSLSGTSWARIWLNGAWRYVAKPFVKIVT